MPLYDVSGGDINPETGKQYAVNPSSGKWDDEYFNNVLKPSLKARGIIQERPPDPIEQAKKLRDFQIQSNQPFIQSLEGQIPETEAKFQTEQNRLMGEKAPLKERYKNILDEINRRESADLSDVGRRQSQEFGLRGIPTSSTYYMDELMKKQNPIRLGYATQAKETGLEQENSLRGIDNLIASLAGQSVEAKRTILNAIGQLKSGDPVSAIQGAMNIVSMAQQQSQYNVQNELARQQQTLAERELNWKTSQTNDSNRYLTLGEGSTVYDLLAGKSLFTAPKTYKPENQFGGANNYYGDDNNSTGSGRYSLIH